MLYWTALISSIVFGVSLVSTAICIYGSHNNPGEGGLMWAVLGIPPMFLTALSFLVLAVCGIVKLCLL